MDYDKRFKLRQLAEAALYDPDIIYVYPEDIIKLLDYIDELENDLTVETHYGE